MIPNGWSRLRSDWWLRVFPSRSAGPRTPHQAWRCGFKGIATSPLHAECWRGVFFLRRPRRHLPAGSFRMGDSEPGQAGKRWRRCCWPREISSSWSRLPKSWWLRVFPLRSARPATCRLTWRSGYKGTGSVREVLNLWCGVGFPGRLREGLAIGFGRAAPSAAARGAGASRWSAQGLGAGSAGCSSWDRVRASRADEAAVFID